MNDHTTLAERIAQARRALDESRYADADMLAQQIIHSDPPPRFMGEALEIAGFAAHYDARYVEARQFAERALLLFRELEDTHGQMRVLYLMGVLHRELNDLTRALEYHLQQAALGEASGDQSEVIRAWNGIAGVYQFSGDYPPALEYARRAFNLAEQVGDRTMCAILGSNILQIYIRMHKHTDGEALIDAIEAMFAQLGEDASPGDLVHFYTRACRYFFDAGNLDRAELYIARALWMTERHVLRRRRAVALGDLGDILIARGQYGAAIAPLTEAWELAVTYNFLPWIDGVLASLVHIHERLGDYAGAFIWQKHLHEQQLSALDAERHRTLRQMDARYQVESARKQAEYFREQANQAETQRQSLARLNDLKDELLTTATHDIKNPLASIRLTLEMIRRVETPERERLGNHVDNIDQQVMRITRLIARLLDLAKLETGATLELTTIRAIDLLAWAAGQFTLPAAARQVHLHILPTDAMLDVMADRDRLEQVLDNLISNAIKYTPHGGDVTLSILPVSGGVEISVTDTGLGIPEEDLPNIHAPFFRVRRDEHLAVEGTGLGLAIVHTILKQHGTILHIESRLGQGSRFSFVLPCAQES